jgi:hypothetical protein
MLASIAGIYITRKIRTGYINSLADSLEAGHIDLEEAAFGTAQRALTGPTETAEVDPSLALGHYRRDTFSAYLKQRHGTLSKDPGAEPSWQFAPLQQVEPPLSTPSVEDQLGLAMTSLRCGDPQTIRRVLNENTPLPAELVSVVLPLLDSPAVREDVSLALRRIAPAHIGALLDALRSERNSTTMRTSICDLLGEVPTQGCANGLLEFLDTDDQELRFRAAASLLRIRRANPQLQIRRRRIFTLAGREASYCRRIWFTQVSLDPKINDMAPVETRAGRRVIQGLTYIFTLLLATLEQQPTILAARALKQSSGAQRGTGIEYLENVLPEPLLHELRPLLMDTRLALGKVSARSEILAEIIQGRLSVADELAELRSHIDKLRSERHKLESS